MHISILGQLAGRIVSVILECDSLCRAIKSSVPERDPRGNSCAARLLWVVQDFVHTLDASDGLFLAVRAQLRIRSTTV